MVVVASSAKTRGFHTQLDEGPDALDEAETNLNQRHTLRGIGKADGMAPEAWRYPRLSELLEHSQQNHHGSLASAGKMPRD